MEPKIERGAAPDIHRIEDASVNWYLVEAESGLTIVDAGVPRSWDSLQRVLGEIGRDASEIRALVLTHAHFDHIGFAERARTELGVPVHVHENDAPLARVGARVPRQLGVALVDADRHPELGPRPLGEADVVEVRVREHHGLHVPGRAPERAERAREGVPRGRHARVDHRQAAAVLDEVPVRVGVLDAVDPGGDLGREHGYARTFGFSAAARLARRLPALPSTASVSSSSERVRRSISTHVSATWSRSATIPKSRWSR